jgi:hypothetical protein
VFGALGIYVAGASGLCRYNEGWMIGLYIALTFVYIINIEASVIKKSITETWTALVPSLWGRLRWFGSLCWLVYLASGIYFLWTHHWFGLDRKTECLDGQGHMGFIALAGMNGIGLLHLLAVILWKMCRKKQAPRQVDLLDSLEEQGTSTALLPLDPDYNKTSQDGVVITTRF